MNFGAIVVVGYSGYYSKSGFKSTLIMIGVGIIVGATLNLGCRMAACRQAGRR